MDFKGYTLKDLEEWDKKIQDIAAGFGLDFFPQEFEIADRDDMLGYMAYSGMPSRYPHWSYGKVYEQTKTKYELGITGLPYEMVINSNPSIAYLMSDNTLTLQLLTIAHVYAHNDFFKNNVTFKFTHPGYTIEKFKTHAARIRSYVADPSIGISKVEPVLDAAHALSMQCRRYPGIKKMTLAEQRQQIINKARPKSDEFMSIRKKEEFIPPDLNKLPLEDDPDLLSFVRDYNPYLSEWERDILTIVIEETSYFIPQIETKVMNEGWASFWHYRIMNELDISDGMKVEFFKHHNQVIRPLLGSINPYFLGFKIFEDIKKRWDEPSKDDREEFGLKGNEGNKKIFLARESDRDISFLRQYLTESMIMDMHLFEHGRKGNDRVVTNISDKENWRTVKETLLNSVGLSTIPVIKIIDANYKKSQILFLRHESDDRELDIEYAEHTLRHLYHLWQRKVILEAKIDGHPCNLAFDGFGKLEITEI